MREFCWLKFVPVASQLPSVQSASIPRYDVLRYEAPRLCIILIWLVSISVDDILHPNSSSYMSQNTLHQKIRRFSKQFCCFLCLQFAVLLRLISHYFDQLPFCPAHYKGTRAAGVLSVQRMLLSCNVMVSAFMHMILKGWTVFDIAFVKAHSPYGLILSFSQAVC